MIMHSSEEEYDDVIHCDFVDIRDYMEKAFSTGKTPLIIDTSDDEKVCTYLSYQTDHSILEAKSMILKLASHSLLDALEYARRMLVNAMKHGKTLVIRMGTSAPDFKSTFHDDNLHKLLNQENCTDFKTCESKTNYESIDVKKNHYFPKEAILEGGRLLRDVGSSRDFQTWADKLFREEDSFPHKNIAYCRDEFRVCFVSQLAPEDIDECLFGSEWGGLPEKDQFQILIVDSSDDEENHS